MMQPKTPEQKPYTPEQLQKAQQLLEAVQTNVERQTELLHKIEINQAKEWNELQELRDIYPEIEKALKQYIRVENMQYGPLKPKANNTEFFKPMPFIALAAEKGLYEDMIKFGVITFSINKKEAENYLAKYPELLPVFNTFRDKRLNYVAVYGVPKQPELENKKK